MGGAGTVVAAGTAGVAGTAEAAGRVVCAWGQSLVSVVVVAGTEELAAVAGIVVLVPLG